MTAPPMMFRSGRIFFLALPALLLGDDSRSQVTVVRTFADLAGSLRRTIVVEKDLEMTRPLTISENMRMTAGQKYSLDGRHSISHLFVVRGTLALADLALKRSADSAIVADDAKIELTRCDALDHRGQKGAVFRLVRSTLTVTDCVFEGNVALDRGGVAFLDQSTFFAERTTFKRNEARRGGAVYVYDSQFAVLKSVFESGRAREQGGAFVLDLHATANVTDTVFLKNSAPRGPALYLRDFSAVTLRNTTGADAFIAGADSSVCQTTEDDTSCHPQKDDVIFGHALSVPATTGALTLTTAES